MKLKIIPALVALYLIAAQPLMCLAAAQWDVL
jgi:hypothetical protein